MLVLFQVEELRRDLRIKSQELEVKNAAANDKLKKMVKDQQEAEKKKARLEGLLNSRLLLRGAGYGCVTCSWICIHRS